MSISVANGGTWKPDLAGDGTLHDRLVEALRGDILGNRLAPGTRLPTHRDLAFELGIGVGTVTKAYAEVERLGLINSRVGRGSFVSDMSATDSTQVDLALNLPPTEPAASRLPDVLSRIARRADISAFSQFAPPLGFDAHRQIAADWLCHNAGFGNADWKRLAICSGAQQAMFLALDHLCEPGDTVMAEAATFHGFKAITEYRRWNILGLPIDPKGLVPSAFEKAAKSGRSRVLYVQPTLQNPTTSSMDRERREAIVSIASRYDVTIVESDIYSPLARRSGGNAEDLVPLVALAPERTFYVGGWSKVMAPGLRAGFLLVPNTEVIQVIGRTMRAHCYAANALGPLIAAEWIETGEADEILNEIVDHATLRNKLIVDQLGDKIQPLSYPGSLHVWMPLPGGIAERVAAYAYRHDILLTPPSATTVEPDPATGIRVCSCASPDLASLRRALTVLRDALDNTARIDISII